MPVKFFVPLAYFLSTRIEGLVALVSWMAIYPLAIVLSVCFVESRLLRPDELVALITAMAATYALYELGYMSNDTRTVRFEAQPTERLDDTQKAFYESNRWLIVGVRMAIVVGLCISIGLLVDDGNTHGLVYYLLGLVAIAVTFPVYNSMRGAINLPVHFVLVTCRFCLPGMTVVASDQPGYFFIMLLAFPLINLLERSGEARYGFPWLHALLLRRNHVRVLYYGLLTIVALFAGGSVAAVSVFAYFLAVRSIALAASRWLPASSRYV